ncbi:hypothetical protein GWK47_023525 [Chionoecetes opilio]|uniref:Uncharacterized protein n=1 Tax=Chionoecetes opilio TaxID=41210 RepID=A0A8J4XW78_CHIOP|nr:hypothetical protein GWK47_023525 [Chionoecetes opilio]
MIKYMYKYDSRSKELAPQLSTKHLVWNQVVSELEKGLKNGNGYELCVIRNHLNSIAGFRNRDVKIFLINQFGSDVDFTYPDALPIHPLFKLPVDLFLNPEKVDAVISSRLLFEVTEQAVLDISEGSSPDEDEEDEFFKVLLRQLELKFAQAQEAGLLWFSDPGRDPRRPRGRWCPGEFRDLPGP